MKKIIILLAILAFLFIPLSHNVQANSLPRVSWTIQPGDAYTTSGAKVSIDCYRDFCLDNSYMVFVNWVQVAGDSFQLSEQQMMVLVNTGSHPLIVNVTLISWSHSYLPLVS
jgi:hypothetical protein